MPACNPLHKMVFVLKFGFLRGSRLASLLNSGTLVQGTAMRIFEG